MKLYHAVISGAKGDPHGPVDGYWQYEAIIVVRVFADQVNAAGCAHDEGGCFAEMIFKCAGYV